MAARTLREKKKSVLPLHFNVYFNLDNRERARLAVRSLSTSMARALKSARRPCKNKTNMISQFRVDKRKIVEVNGEWKLYKQQQQQQGIKYTNPEGGNIAASSLQFTVSGKI